MGWKQTKTILANTLKALAAVFAALAGLAAAKPALAEEAIMTRISVIDSFTDRDKPYLVKQAYNTDVNGDGRVDIVVATVTFNYLFIPVLPPADPETKLEWYENKGGSPLSFTKHAIPMSLKGIVHVALGDLNGDGRQDIVVSTNRDDVAWYRNDGQANPAFTETILRASAAYPTIPIHIRHFALCDLDKDGDMDIVTGAWAYKSDFSLAFVEWLENYQDGNKFTLIGSPSPVSHVYEAREITGAADFTNDGYPDIIASNLDENGSTAMQQRIYVIEHRGTRPPLFTARRAFGVDTVGYVGYCQPADLDDDGRMDICSNYHKWLQNPGPGSSEYTLRTVQATTSTYHYTPALKPVDLDHDGDTDLVAPAIAQDALGSLTHFKLTWYSSNGARPPVFVPRLLANRYIDVTLDMWHVAGLDLADLDGDGDLDFTMSFRDHLSWAETNPAMVPVELSSMSVD